MNDKQRQLQTALDALVARKGMRGAMVVRRDGIAVQHAGRAQFSPETFAAMCAVAVGAVETAFSELGASSGLTIRAETKAFRLYMSDVSPEVVLVTVAERSMDWDALAQASAQAATEIGRMLTA